MITLGLVPGPPRPRPRRSSSSTGVAPSNSAAQVSTVLKVGTTPRRFSSTHFCDVDSVVAEEQVRDLRVGEAEPLAAPPSSTVQSSPSGPTPLVSLCLEREPRSATISAAIEEPTIDARSPGERPDGHPRRSAASSSKARPGVGKRDRSSSSSSSSARYLASPGSAFSPYGPARGSAAPFAATRGRSDRSPSPRRRTASACRVRPRARAASRTPTCGIFVTT